MHLWRNTFFYVIILKQTKIILSLFFQKTLQTYKMLENKISLRR